MKDAILFFSISLLCLILYMHKLDINDIKERLNWLESVTFESARCPDK